MSKPAYISIEDVKLPSIRHRVEYFDHCLRWKLYAMLDDLS